MSDVENEPLADSESHPETPEMAPARPPYLPEKFWDEATGTVRVEALAKSYGELERKLGTRRVPAEPSLEMPEPAVDAVPASDQTPTPICSYSIVTRHPLVTQDAELDSRLIAAGLSEHQAQLVYDLAAEKLAPLVEELLGEVEVQRQIDRLENHFGGPEAWRQTARQLKGWATAHLPGDVAAALSSSFEGIVTLHKMVQASEPELLSGGDPTAGITEDTLAEMMRDPRYWRNRDPDFVARVTAGFKRLYAG